MNTQRLQKLADFLRKLPPERFHFGKVVIHETSCGTIGCAMGWTPAVFPELVEWSKGKGTYPLTYCPNGGPVDYDDLASTIFDIDRDDAFCLFTPEHQNELDMDDLPVNATPSQVADLIEEYIRLKS